MPVGAFAAPLNLSGSVSINSTSTQAGGITNTARYLTGSLAASSYIYQPWLMTWGASGSVNRNVSESGSAQSRGVIVTGGLETAILPRSRFPLSLDYRVTDSAIQMQSEATPDGRLSDNRTNMLTVRSNISMLSGSMVSAWYNKTDWASTGVVDSRSTAESIGANTSWRSTIQTLSLSGSAFKSENFNNATVAENSNVSLSHSLSPQPQSGLSTLLTYTTNSNSVGSSLTTDTSAMNATSNFYWRPDYRPVSLSGAVSMRDSQMANGVGAQNLGVNVGLNYTVSRALRAFVNFGGSINQSNDIRSGTATQALGVNYAPESLYLGKSSYNWGAGLSLNNNISRGAGLDNSLWALNGNMNHNLSRSWQLAQRQTLTLTGSQGLALPWREDGQQPIGLSNSVRTSWSHSGEDSTTTAWASVTDTRQLGDGQSSMDASSSSEFRPVTAPTTQMLTASLRRTQNLNRLSSLSADITMNARRQSGQNNQPVSTSGSAEYGHSRLFGVYQLRFRSILVLSQASATQGPQTLTSRLDNRVDYSIGLMTMSAAFNVVQSGKAESRMLIFQMTRRF